MSTHTRATVVEPQEVLDALKAFTAKYQYQHHAAKALGVSGPFLTDMLKGFRPISQKVLTVLGLRRAVVRGGK